MFLVGKILISLNIPIILINVSVLNAIKTFGVAVPPTFTKAGYK